MGNVERRLGKHFIVGLSGPVLSELDKRILSKLKPRGVLLLKRNFSHEKPYESWHKDLVKLIYSIREITEQETPIVSLDHEGGRVHRTPPPVTHFPSPYQYRKRVTEVARAMGEELRSLGVNVSWSPLADINSNPKNPVIGDRSFGATPGEVIEYATQFLRAIQGRGVLGCLKHFPGHGDTSTDSHFELPVVNATLDELKARELFPFRALCAQDAPFVMTAHILFPRIDAQAPATFSRKFLTEMLKNEWGYKGIVVSDDLDMKAVSLRFDKDDAIAHSMIAGCDMFIVARHPDGNSDRPLRIAAQMLGCLNKGILSENVFEESQERIDKCLSERLKYFEPAILSMDQFGKNEELSVEIEKDSD